MDNSQLELEKDLKKQFSFKFSRVKIPTQTGILLLNYLILIVLFIIVNPKNVITGSGIDQNKKLPSL